MRLSWRLIVNLVAVVALGAGMVGWVIFELVGGGAFEDDMSVTAEFASSGGVFTNQEVTYRGVSVGKVGAMTLTPGGVDIELLIEPEWDGRIPADVTAAVQSKSAVGEQFVNLTPDEMAGAARLEDGDRIPRTRTRLPVDFQKLLVTVDNVLRDVPPGQTRRVIRAAAGGLAGRGEEIGTILESLATLSDAFADIAPEQQRFLSNATTTGSAFLRTKEDFAAAIKAADEVFAGMGDEPEELRALLANNDRLAREGLRLIEKHAHDLRSGIRGLNGLVDFQLRHRDEIIVKSLRFVPDFFRAIEEASVPWIGADGEVYYRIRTGLVVDNVPATWPCKYDNKLEWERFHFEREPRPTYTDLECRTETLDASELELDPDVVAALKAMAATGAPSPRPAETLGAAPRPHDGPQEPPVLSWPVAGPVISRFDPASSAPRGVDIAAPRGALVRPAAPGHVVTAGVHGWFGNFVVVEHAGGVETLYAHLDTIAVDPGTQVVRGAALGTVGCTGVCETEHLHLEVRVDGRPVDPLSHLPGGPLFGRFPPAPDGFAAADVVASELP